MRYQSKQELLDDIRREHATLVARLDEIPADRYREPGVWGDGWDVRDLVAHLAEWHTMLLGWHAGGEAGRMPEMPAPGYRWNETPRLNRDIQAKHADRDPAVVRQDFDRTFRDVLELVEELSEERLLEPGHFRWTGKNALVTYVGANTASHYRFARKVLKRWRRTAP